MHQLIGGLGQQPGYLVSVRAKVRVRVRVRARVRVRVRVKVGVSSPDTKWISECSEAALITKLRLGLEVGVGVELGATPTPSSSPNLMTRSASILRFRSPLNLP